MKKLLVFGICMLMASPALAVLQETVSFVNVPSQGGSGMVSYNMPVVGGYNMGNLDWDGYASVINAGTYGSELTLDISGPLGAATITLGSGTTYSPGAAFAGISSVFDNAGDPAGMWNWDFYESYDDGGDGLADANWDYIDFGFYNHEVDPDEAAFLAQVAPGYYLEDFDGYTYGSYTLPTLDMGPVNGFSYTISTDPNSDFLWSGPGNMSTNSANSKLKIDFTGDDVLAIGGLFFGGLIDGSYTQSTVTVELSDGTSQTYVPTGANDFEYWFTAVPITSMTIEAVDANGGAAIWPTMDHFYVGVPEPASLGLLLLGGVFFARRRK